MMSDKCKRKGELMSGPSCYNCVYAICDPEVWLRDAYFGRRLLMQCANDPMCPGRLCEVPGIPCRNYRRKPVSPRGDVRLIPLSDGSYAYVDAADYEWLSRYNWYSLNGYAARYANGKNIFMHREIMRPPEGMFVDHADGSRANNCRFNLRVCTRAENMHNTRGQPRSGSMFKGVSYDKNLRKWRAQCRCGGKKSKCIYFDDEVEAARAYDRVAVEYFGEFARLNFPQEWPPERRQQIYAQRDAVAKEEARPSVGATHASPAQGKSKKPRGRTPRTKPRTTRAEGRARNPRRGRTSNAGTGPSRPEKTEIQRDRKEKKPGEKGRKKRKKAQKRQ